MSIGSWSYSFPTCLVQRPVSIAGGAPVPSVRATVPSVPAAVDRLSRRVRMELGETDPELARSAVSVGKALTSDLEAYRHYFLGEQCAARPIYGQDCSPHFRRAAERDPAFAAAHYQLSLWSYWFGGPREEQLSSIARAMAHAADAPEKEQLLIRAWDAWLHGREEEALSTYAAVTVRWPKDRSGWYQHGEHGYNECLYQPQGWEVPCRFVVMRIRKDELRDRQLPLLDGEPYAYRVFVTNVPGRPHTVIEDYDQRAAVEPLIGEAQREGVLAIPSKRFQAHHAFFQLVMLAYNLWRWMKLLAGHAERQAQQGTPVPEPQRIRMPDHTVRIARLKMLYVAAKIRFHSNRDEVLYSVHEQRAAGLMDFLGYLDRRRKAA